MKIVLETMTKPGHDHVLVDILIVARIVFMQISILNHLRKRHLIIIHYLLYFFFLLALFPQLILNRYLFWKLAGVWTNFHYKMLTWVFKIYNFMNHAKLSVVEKPRNLIFALYDLSFQFCHIFILRIVHFIFG